jgi:polyisoprenoid-binding protein YceI
MKKLVIFAFVLVVSLTGFAQTWSIDNSHSKLNFSVSHMMISDTEGSFKKFTSKITSSKEDFSDAIIEFSADVNSIDTDNEQRDTHLKNPDFFDAAKFSSISFKSTSIKKVSEKKYKVTGSLTMHGITKTIELDVTLNGIITHPYTKKQVAGFKISGSLKRSDFNIAVSTPASMVGDEVSINANTEFVKD